MPSVLCLFGEERKDHSVWEFPFPGNLQFSISSSQSSSLGLFFLVSYVGGKAMVAYTMPQQRKRKERSERLRGERDQVKFIDLWLYRFVLVSYAGNGHISIVMLGKSHMLLLWPTQCPQKVRKLGEGDQIKFIDFRFERRQAVWFRKGSQDVALIASSWDQW